jgi:hypothetical protein
VDGPTSSRRRGRTAARDLASAADDCGDDLNELCARPRGRAARKPQLPSPRAQLPPIRAHLPRRSLRARRWRVDRIRHRVAGSRRLRAHTRSALALQRRSPGSISSSSRTPSWRSRSSTTPTTSTIPAVSSCARSRFDRPSGAHGASTGGIRLRPGRPSVRGRARRTADGSRARGLPSQHRRGRHRRRHTRGRGDRTSTAGHQATRIRGSRPTCRYARAAAGVATPWASADRVARRGHRACAHAVVAADLVNVIDADCSYLLDPVATPKLPDARLSSGTSVRRRLAETLGITRQERSVDLGVKPRLQHPSHEGAATVAPLLCTRAAVVALRRGQPASGPQTDKEGASIADGADLASRESRRDLPGSRRLLAQGGIPDSERLAS